MQGLKQKKSGLSVIEVTLVLAISAVMIVIVLGLISTRRRNASDEAAKQLVSSIQTVQNEAQKGLGAGNGIALPHDYQIFGEMMVFRNDCSGKACIDVYKLMRGIEGSANANVVSAYQKYSIDVGNQLRFYVDAASSATPVCSIYISCYDSGAGLKTLSSAPVSLGASSDLVVVTRVVSGTSYVFSVNPNLITAPDSLGVMDLPADVKDVSKYTSNRTGELRLAVLQPLQQNPAAIDQAVAQSALTKYYLNLHLSVNGDVQLKVVK